MITKAAEAARVAAARNLILANPDMIGVKAGSADARRSLFIARIILARGFFGELPRDIGDAACRDEGENYRRDWKNAAHAGIVAPRSPTP